MPGPKAVVTHDECSLKWKLETGLGALLTELPPHLRPLVRHLSPQIFGYLRSASEEKIREALEKVRNTVNELLEEG